MEKNLLQIFVLKKRLSKLLYLIAFFILKLSHFMKSFRYRSIYNDFEVGDPKHYFNLLYKYNQIEKEIENEKEKNNWSYLL